MVLGGSISAGGEVRNFDTEAYFPQTTVRLPSPGTAAALQSLGILIYLLRLRAPRKPNTTSLGQVKAPTNSHLA